MAGWRLAIEGNDGHAIPVADLVEHEESEDCVCGPRVCLLGRPDGSDAWAYTHHSLDGREHAEEGHDVAECPGCRGAAA